MTRTGKKSFFLFRARPQPMNGFLHIDCVRVVCSFRFVVTGFWVNASGKNSWLMLQSFFNSMLNDSLLLTRTIFAMLEFCRLNRKANNRWIIIEKVNGILKVIELLFHSEARCSLWQRWMNYFLTVSSKRFHLASALRCKAENCIGWSGWKRVNDQVRLAMTWRDKKFHTKKRWPEWRNRWRISDNLCGRLENFTFIIPYPISRDRPSSNQRNFSTKKSP